MRSFFILLTTLALTFPTVSGKRALKGKATKSSKSSKKSGGGAQVALIHSSPSYTGDEFFPVGTVTVQYNPDGSLLMLIDSEGIDSACESCMVTVTDGDSCEDPGDNYFKTEDDPWASGDAYYSSFSMGGTTLSAFRVINGYDADDMLGHPVLIYSNAGEVIGCGLLKEEVIDKVLHAKMGKYPGYEGDLEVEGDVKVSFEEGNTFLFSFDLEELEENCSGCGIHIHAGYSCATHEEVLGHEWNQVSVQDLWTSAGGATYDSDEDGDSEGSFYIYNGFSYYENFGHAVVIHASDGTRVGCGVLG